MTPPRRQEPSAARRDPAPSRRDPALARVAQHHARGLAQARALRRAAARPAEVRQQVALAFLEYFETEAIPHTQEEERTLFPAMLANEAPADTVSMALSEHERLRVLARRLREGLEDGAPDAAVMRELSALLYRHIGREELELVPYIRQALAARPQGGH